MTEAGHSSQAAQMSIRKGISSDAPAIAAIHVRSWIATYGKPPSGGGLDMDISHRTELWERRLDEQGMGRHISVAMESRPVVGFIYFGLSPDVEDNSPSTSHVFSIHVEPTLTDRGIGRRLLGHAVDELAAGGCLRVTLWVVASNRKSRGFYERLGWQSDGKHRWEELALEGEQGDQVEVVRYYLELAPRTGEGR